MSSLIKSEWHSPPLPESIPFEMFRVVALVLGLTERGVHKMTIDANGVTVEQHRRNESGAHVTIGKELAKTVTQIPFTPQLVWAGEERP